MRIRGIVSSLAFVLVGATAAFAVAGFVTMEKFSSSPPLFQFGYVAGVSDMNDAVIGRAGQPDTTKFMICLQKMTDNMAMGQIVDWVLSLNRVEKPATQAADAMLVNACRAP